VIERQEEHCEYLQFERLAEIPGLVHAVFTRRRGFSAPPFAGLNASSVTGDDLVAVRRNKAEIVAALGLPLVATRPVHGAAVAVVERESAAEQSADWWEPLQARLRHIEADAMMSDQAGFAFCWAYGDCAPILLFDPEHGAFALLHAGWRGTATEVVPAAVAGMAERYGSRPAALLAGIGPAIGACCYEVNESVEQAFAAHPLALECARFARRDVGGRAAVFLDIAASNYHQLLAVGIHADHIDDSGYCTGCRTDVFYSNRREPKPNGRFAVAIGLLPV
jgi:polyphenol oxidase